VLKRLILAASALLVVGSLLAGCSGDGSGAPVGKNDTPEMSKLRKEKEGKD
jgi:hypothetical protein